MRGNAPSLIAEIRPPLLGQTLSQKSLDKLDFAGIIWVTITNALFQAPHISDTETIRWQAILPPGCVVSFF